MRRLIFIIILLVINVFYLARADEYEGTSRYLVSFEKGTKKITKDAIKARFGDVVKSELQLVDAALVVLPSPDDAEELKKIHGVERVTLDMIYIERAGKPQPPTGEQLPWGVDRIDADKVWYANGGNKGTGIRVAVLDSGIDIDHTDLAENIKWGINTVGTDPPSNDYNDNEGHGTMIAGIIAARYNDCGVIGVAPEAFLYAVKFRVMGYMPPPGDPFNVYLSDLLEGMEWCLKGPDGVFGSGDDSQVINMSFSVWSVRDNNGNIERDKPLHVPEFYNLIQQAYAAGIVQVAAVTNDSVRVEEVPEGMNPGEIVDTTSYRFPASYNQVIGVSATAKAGKNDRFASFSNYGSVVDLAAPGDSILSTTKGTGCQTATGGGTSYSCPHVVGVAALVLKKFQDLGQNLGPEEVKAELKNTAEPIGSLTAEQQGAGMVDAQNAVLGVRTAPPGWPGLSSAGKISIAWGRMKRE